MQATESIITHLEKLDAPPEEDDEYQDETTDFTLFDVSITLFTELTPKNMSAFMIFA